MPAPADVIDRTRSKERIAAWFDKSLEGFWRIDLKDPRPCEGTKSLWVEHILARGTIAECNAAMASMLQEGGSVDPVGMPLERYPFFTPILVALVEAGFDLVDWELAKTASHEGCVVNAVGVFEEGRLVRIWGRCREDFIGTDLEIRVMSALEEQQREIGYELHDGLGQLLIAARLVSYNIADLVSTSEEEVRAQCNHMVSLTDQALDLLQRIARELAPDQFLNGTSLTDALEDLAHMTSRFLGVHCTFTYDEEAEPIDPEKQIHVYRIVQEAVNNAVKHAESHQVDILLKKIEPGMVQFEVKDDGIGFRKDEKGKNSLGLKSMVHRARLIGARLEIDSVPGESTSIRCSVPVANISEELNRQPTGFNSAQHTAPERR